MNIKVEDFRTKFQNVALTADIGLIFLRIWRHLGFSRETLLGPGAKKDGCFRRLRFFKSTGMSSQRTDAEKATVCFPVLVRSLGLYNFVWKHIWYYTHDYFLRIENNFETRLVADIYAKDA